MSDDSRTCDRCSTDLESEYEVLRGECSECADDLGGRTFTTQPRDGA